MVKATGEEKCYADYTAGQELYKPPAGYGQLKETPVTTRAPAGKPHNAPEKGGGAWTLQTEWSIGSTGEKPDYNSELQSSFKPPPADYKKPAPSEIARKSDFPSPTDVTNYTTGYSEDFAHGGAQPTRKPYRPGPSQVTIQAPEGGDAGAGVGEAMGASVTSAYNDQFRSRGGEAAGVRAAGNPLTAPAGYNIITGAQPMSAGISNYENYSESQDVHRHRPY
mmetsp:Transcript_2680/g.9098  ORF Transcript_2680/g.9098 Transcript_2680/m.9098 type:complete len:222 (-) Transcript_2680:657-1322(-)